MSEDKLRFIDTQVIPGDKLRFSPSHPRAALSHSCLGSQSFVALWRYEQQFSRQCRALSSLLQILFLYPAKRSFSSAGWCLPQLSSSSSSSPRSWLCSPDIPLRRNWQRMGAELAARRCLLMIRRAGRAWGGMSAAIIHSLPRSTEPRQELPGRGAVPGLRRSSPGPGLCPQAGSGIVWAADALICCFVRSAGIPLIAHTAFIRHSNLDNERNA